MILIFAKFQPDRRIQTKVAKKAWCSVYSDGFSLRLGVAICSHVAAY